MIVLGIDPGLQVTGFGILQKNEKGTFLVHHGYLRMSSQQSIAERITQFHDFFMGIIEQYKVTTIALETPFLGKNAQNFLKLGYLRGIVYLLVHKHKLQLLEFSPREVKQTITGFGGASKEQVARVVMQLFPMLKAPDKLDVTDAIAIMLCGLWAQQKSKLYAIQSK